jgi:serine/threonine protein kinase
LYPKIKIIQFFKWLTDWSKKENLDASPEAQRQFKREAQIVCDLAHPNLPKVIDHFVLPGKGGTW